MHVARLAEKLILEVVIFEIGDGVAHIVLTGEEGLFPHDLVAAANARSAHDVGRGIAKQKLRPE